MVKKALLFAWAAMAVDCTPVGHSSLRARSAGDLHCPAEDVKIYKLDERSFRVVGCTREAVYIDSCQQATVGRDCTWIMNSDSDNLTRRAAAEPGTAGGCSYDNQCKGDRICVQHQCAAPTVGATSP